MLREDRKEKKGKKKRKKEKRQQVNQEEKKVGRKEQYLTYNELNDEDRMNGML